MKRVLFACVGNSCRSQMAEALCRRVLPGVECASAGSRPARKVHPLAVEVMAEAGIDISGARPKGFDDLPDLRWDLLVTMGCEVECPFLPGARIVGWEIPDPTRGDLDAFRHVRDLIGRLLEDLTP